MFPNISQVHIAMQGKSQDLNPLWLNNFKRVEPSMIQEVILYKLLEDLVSSLYLRWLIFFEKPWKNQYERYLCIYLQEYLKLFQLLNVLFPKWSATSSLCSVNLNICWLHSTLISSFYNLRAIIFYVAIASLWVPDMDVFQKSSSSSVAFSCYPASSV